jgi:hypothetical protein
MEETPKPLDQTDIDDLKDQHRLDISGLYRHGCAYCGEPWPCRVVSLVAEVEEHRRKREQR